MNTSSDSKYDRLAHGFAEKEYADPQRYNLRKVSIAVDRGHHRLQAGDTVIELGCGDGITSFYFAQAYRTQVIGIDSSSRMVEEARKRCNWCTPRPVFLVGDLNDLEGLDLPNEMVQCVTLFRASYYVHDWIAFASQIRQRTRKLVIDVDPRRDDLGAMSIALREAGFRRLWSRPFFTPMTCSLPAFGYWVLEQAESIPVVRDLILRRKFLVVVIAEA